MALILDLVVLGLLPNKAEGKNDMQVCREALGIKGVYTALYAEGFVK